MMLLFCTILLNISFVKEDEKTLQELSSQFFSLPEEECTIQKHSEANDMAESGFDNTIFLIGDKKGVLKAIPLTSSDAEYQFRSEFEALELLHHLPLKTFHAIGFKGIAEVTLNGVATGIIAEEHAPGFSLNTYLKKMAKAKHAERNRLFQELCQGVEKTAVALAELHTYNTLSKPAPKYVAKYSTPNLPGPFGIIHGDTHPGNIFYDPVTNTLSFIDFTTTYPSRLGAPIAQDVANFLLTLDIFASYYHLSDSEKSILRHTFLNRYKKDVPSIRDESIAFYTAYFIETFATNNSWDQEVSKQAKFVHNYCKEIA